MKHKSRFFALFFCCLAVPFICASGAGESVSTSLRQALDLEQDGKYLEARQIYEQILSRENMEASERETVRESYESLNMKILLSRTETSDSVFYEVQPGDNLYKIASKYRTTVALIKKINGLKNHTIYPGMKLKIETGKFGIRVDKSDNKMKVFLSGKPLKTYAVATGTENGTPTGTFKIVNKLENPTWYHAGAVVSPDSPDNVLGTRWMGFDYPGYGIHGTTLPESIGKQVTAGCIRMFNHEVEELYDLIPSGTEVTVVD